ncbi:Hypothetical protein PFR_JS22-1_664 [Propionibacterium freudenreichii]|nr:Hypothetical protein PFR_JS22-1_664 [Propionibacterium freudenreichii]
MSGISRLNRLWHAVKGILPVILTLVMIVASIIVVLAITSTFSQLWGWATFMAVVMAAIGAVSAWLNTKRGSARQHHDSLAQREMAAVALLANSDERSQAVAVIELSQLIIDWSLAREASWKTVEGKQGQRDIVDYPEWDRIRELTRLAFFDIDTTWQHRDNVIIRVSPGDGGSELVRHVRAERLQLVVKRFQATPVKAGWSHRGARILLPYLDFSCIDLRGQFLGDINLSGVKLAGAKLEESDLSNATLTGADLTGATYSGKRSRSGRTLPETRFPEGFDPESVGMIRVE